MAVTVEKTIYEPWGNCIRVSNGKVEFYATVDFGPQIIRFGVVGKHNMFFEDLQDNVNKDLSAYGVFKGEAWHIFGGHRFWVSPEAEPQSYYPAIDPVAYELLPDGVILKQCVQEYTQIALQMTVTMQDCGTVTVVHRLVNKGAWPVELAPWALSVMAQGGVEVVPQPNRETGLLGNRVLALWPYTDMSDPRVTWGEKYILLRQDKTMERAFKFGLNNEKGFAAYFLKGCMFLNSYEAVLDGNYPDFGVSFETYTSNHILEMETLGELTVIKPEQSVVHTETWKLIDGVEMGGFSEKELDAVFQGENLD